MAHLRAKCEYLSLNGGDLKATFCHQTGGTIAYTDWGRVYRESYMYRPTVNLDIFKGKIENLNRNDWIELLHIIGVARFHYIHICPWNALPFSDPIAKKCQRRCEICFPG